MEKGNVRSQTFTIIPENFSWHKNSVFYENILFHNLKVMAYSIQIIYYFTILNNIQFPIILQTKQARKSKPGLKIVARVYN